jgi:site-specific recombinase XerD
MERFTARAIEQKIQAYLEHLRSTEKSGNTLKKYTRDLRRFARFLITSPKAGSLQTALLTKETLIAYKNELCRLYKATSVNSMLAPLNGFLSFLGLADRRLKPLRIQKQVFRDKGKELCQAEYLRLLETASALGQTRLYLLLQTICATGIRVGELEHITVESVLEGIAYVRCKGKIRMIFIPGALRKVLLAYIKVCNLTTGCVFRTRSGKPVDRSNIWRELKNLCRAAGVAASKVFPHNLRHLFARTFYALEKDIAKLADILGHSDIRTTHRYIMTSGQEHERLVNRMKLVALPRL